MCSDASKVRAVAETSATARSNASMLALEGVLKPESLRTNCTAEAWISSSVAGGSKLNRVLMFRHIIGSLAGTHVEARNLIWPPGSAIGGSRFRTAPGRMIA